MAFSFLDLLDIPKEPTSKLIAAVRSGNLWEAVDPALALVAWLRDKLTAPQVVGSGAGEPHTDTAMCDALENLCKVSSEPGSTFVGADPGSTILSLILPWLLDLLRRALTKNGPK